MPFKGFNLEALDGYLSALALSPEPVAAGAMAAADLGRAAALGRRAERAQVDAMLEDQLHLATQRACFEGDELPDDCWRRCCGCRKIPMRWPTTRRTRPVNWMSAATGPSVSSAASSCARRRGTAGWTSTTGSTKSSSLLDQLASGEILADDPTQPPTPIDYRQRLDIIAACPACSPTCSAIASTR